MTTTLRAAMRAFLAAGLLMSSACYTYRPLEGPATVGMEVRARLTNETALRESEFTGVFTQNYQGRVMAATSDSLKLSIVAARAIGPSQTQTARRIVGLPLTGVASLEERTLSTARTALAVASGGAIVVGIVGGVLTAGGGNGGDDGGGDPAFRAALRFLWPF